MPSISKKQKRFFQAVKRAKHEPGYGDAKLHKVANSMTDKDIDDFTKSIAELKVKKAILGILRDIKEPIYGTLEEGDTDVVVKEFNVEGKFEDYVKRYVGQSLTEKEMEAVNTFQEVKPTKIERNQIRYETTDTFKNSTTTLIKKLKEGSGFVFVAFTKYSKAEKPGNQQQQSSDMGGLGGGLGSPMFETDQPTPTTDMSIPTNSDFAAGTAPYEEAFKQKYLPKKESQSYLNWPESKPLNEVMPADPMAATSPVPPISSGMGGAPAPGVGPMTTTAPMNGTPKSPEEKKKEMGIDDILVRKSTTYTEDIKGGAILAEFLKKLDL